ncbi:MAG: pseudouridine-5'-phosphate glycosidase, partial [Proteobacteria bacterium]|nr:pseudouridine-5'-phosphate glycosidase [Pseudomonadota bacterium]
MDQPYTLSAPVRDALHRGLALVGLETAVLTHGLPRPVNLETFRAMEMAVRAGGAVPAPVALVGGRLSVGLSAEEIAHLGEASRAAKAGVADLPALAARGADA